MNGTTRGEIVDEASNWLVGGGIVTMALFPLALPGIALLAVAAIPVVALAVPLLLIGGLALAWSASSAPWRGWRGGCLPAPRASSCGSLLRTVLDNPAVGALLVL